MTLTPHFYLVLGAYKRKVILFTILLFASVLGSHFFSMKGAFLGDGLVMESLVRTSFGFYTASSVFVFMLFFILILARAVGVFWASFLDNDPECAEGFGIKFVTLPAIPYEARMFEFVNKINSRIARKDGRMSQDALDRFGVDRHGNLLDQEAD